MNGVRRWLSAFWPDRDTFRRVYRSKSGQRLALSMVPALIAFVVTTFTDFAPVNPGSTVVLWWTPGEVGIIGFLVGAGALWASRVDIRIARERLREAREAEETRRAVSAIGVAASWDLDLDRLYQRISQDLRSLIEFDRFTITTAQSTGRMRIEFMSGDASEGLPVGSLLAETPDQPDGLFPEYAPHYGSRLTAAIPACNGTLTIRSHQPNYYTPVDLDLLRQVVAQISPGIANAILFQASEQRVQERTVLAEIGRAVTSVLDPRAIVEALDTSLSKLITYDHLGVILSSEDSDSDAETGAILYWSNTSISDHKEGEYVRFYAGDISESGAVSITRSDPLQKDAATGDENGGRTWIQVPLVVQEQLIGLLMLSSVSPEAFSDEESALLLNISLQIAPAIQNALLAASLKRQADERRSIAAIGLAANEELMLDAIHDRIAEELAKVVPFDRLAISHASPEYVEGDMEIEFVKGIEVDGFRTGDLVPGLTREYWRAVGATRDWDQLPDSLKPLEEQGGLKSRTSAFLGSEQNIEGVLSILSTQPDAYDAQTTDFLERVAIQITPALRNARMIAAERELRETLDRQNKELEEANNARKQFLSSVSHELKTPLTIISGFVDLLMDPEVGNDEEQRVETLNIVRRNANQLDVLINDILDISRLDAGTFKINPTPFFVNELVSDLEASFQSLVRTKAQTLRVEMTQDEVWLNADRSRISQVITNLVSNASKYSPEETQITLLCELAGERLHVAVIDQGIGMTKEEQKGLFTAFFRVDNETTRKVSGTGLGLLIAKSITELHGGELSLESEPGKGTKIEFWLPGLSTEEAAESVEPDQSQFLGSRLWPDGPPGEIELGA